MKKLILSLILILALLVPTAFALCEAAPICDPVLPSSGDSIHGFNVLSTFEIDLLDATGIVMQHEKTGASLVYIACEDTNRVFSIGFRTPAKDDKGIPHVFEHATLSGSEKYPDPSLFFSMTSQTYNTFLNAMTYQSSTVFPSASLSEEQLYAFVDYTLSCVSNPLIMIDEYAMMREAYRYELDNRDADITLLGTVYSEMQGVTNINSAAVQNLHKELYPGSIKSNSAGGEPSEIPTIEYRELKDFHNAYYHPSNSLIMLYGKLDYERFLKKLDEDYLSKYDYRDIVITDDLYKPFTGHRDAVIMFPTASDVALSPIAVYGISLPGATVEEVALLEIAGKVIGNEGSRFYNYVKEKLPNSTLNVTVNITSADPTLAILSGNVGGEDMQVFRSAVDEAIGIVLSEGLDKDLLRSACNRQHYNDALIVDSMTRGIDYIGNYSLMWGCFDDLWALNEYMDAESRLNEYIEADAFNAALRKYLAAPVRSALVVTQPEPGGLERRSAELNKSLADMKAAMTDEEIDALIARTADFRAWTEKNAETSLIDRMNVVDVRSLPEETIYYTADTQDIDGMRFISSRTEIHDVVEVGLRFDISCVPAELLKELGIYRILLNSMPTESRSMTDIKKQLNDYVNSCVYSTSNPEYVDGSFRPQLCATWMTTLDNLESSFALIQDILFSSDYSDASLLRMRARDYYANTRTLFPLIPDMLLESYLLTLSTDYGAFSEALSGIGFDRLIKQIMNMTDEEIAQLAGRIREARDIALNSNNFTVTCIGGEEAIRKTIECSLALKAKLSDISYEPADYSSLPVPYVSPLGLVIDSTVQYNAQGILFRDCGFEFSGKLLAMDELVKDKVLYNILRFQNAAYGARTSILEPLIYVGSYRDPKLIETYDVFANLGDSIRALKLTQSDLDGYISNAYSRLSMPCGPITGARTAVDDAITGKSSFDSTVKLMREVKQFSLSDVEEYSKIYDKLAQTGVKVTIGSSEAINANSDMFGTILTDFVDE